MSVWKQRQTKTSYTLTVTCSVIRSKLKSTLLRERGRGSDSYMYKLWRCVRQSHPGLKCTPVSFHSYSSLSAAGCVYRSAFFTESLLQDMHSTSARGQRADGTKAQRPFICGKSAKSFCDALKLTVHGTSVNQPVIGWFLCHFPIMLVVDLTCKTFSPAPEVLTNGRAAWLYLHRYHRENNPDWTIICW